MKKLNLLLFLLFTSFALSADPGDTTIVQTFSFAQGRQVGCKTAKFAFPSDSLQYEKILMLYSAKCDNAFNPACGEWDYDKYTNILIPNGTNGSGDPIYDYWQLGCFVTPYGNGLNMGTNGFTWIYDVSDFVQLLRDSVIIQDCNEQENVDIKFLFIEGVPARDVLSIRKIWHTTPNLSNFDNIITDTTVTLLSQEKGAKLLTTVTGHYFGGAHNCAEFCHNIHTMKVNGATIRSWDIIQQCDNNPIYPQGGTWIYDRAGWCPGMPATTQIFELTPYIQNQSVSFDYDITYDPDGVYHVDIILVTYGETHQQNDVRLVDVLRPSDNRLYSRFNPSSESPLVVIQNIGSDPITSLIIKYGFENCTQETFLYSAFLAPFEKDTVALYRLNLDEVNGTTGIFYVTLENPNHTNDLTPYNNTIRQKVTLPPVYDTQDFQVLFRTNTDANETSWRIRNLWGTVLYQSETNLSPKTLYTTDMVLGNGSYVFEVFDTEGDGLYGWLNGTNYNGSLSLRRKSSNGVFSTVRTIPSFFGSYDMFYFAAKTHTGIDNQSTSLKSFTIYPNPASHYIELDMKSISGKHLIATIFDLSSRELLSQKVKGNQNNRIDINSFSSGIYFVKLFDGKQVIGQEKFLVID